MAHHEHAPRTYICELCGNEADMILKEEPSSPEARPKKQATLVCKVCGNEAEMVLEEE